MKFGQDGAVRLLKSLHLKHFAFPVFPQKNNDLHPPSNTSKMSQVNKPDFKRFNSALEVVSQQGALIASMADGEGVQNFVHILSGLRNDMNCLREEVAEMRQKLDGKLKKGQDEIMDTPWDDKRLASE